MTDNQLILSIEKRANKRLSNFLFIKTLNLLKQEARLSKFEKPVIDYLVDLCKTFRIKLDEFDMECIEQPRDMVLDKERVNRLFEVGIVIRAFKNIGK